MWCVSLSVFSPFCANSFLYKNTSVLQEITDKSLFGSRLVQQGFVCIADELPQYCGQHSRGTEVKGAHAGVPYKASATRMTFIF